MSTFHLGINMAGAVSAGAYTAGVLDFLIQALDEWYRAREQGLPVPLHDVRIEGLSGASAGGMCAAISSQALYEDFAPVVSQMPADSGANKLYRCWVEKIDISELLTTRDLAKNPSRVLSFLDSSCLEDIATYALTPGSHKARPYVAEKLNIFLTLTNLRGVPYSVNLADKGSFEEEVDYYADQLQFEIVKTATSSQETEIAKQLPIDDPAHPTRELLKQAAMATGAFPLMLAPRVLARDALDYNDKRWTFSTGAHSQGGVCRCETSIAVPPAWKETGTLQTVNVDGGATNNNPFECMRRYLTTVDLSPGVQPPEHNPRTPDKADRAVLTIAPFPGEARFNPNYDVSEAVLLTSAFQSLLGALIAQSRFHGESLSLLKDPENYSRFVVAPVDERCPGGRALMCGCLGAFGGFLAREFRDRDFQLGRRNCQRFLREYFVLPEDNVVVRTGLPPNSERAKYCSTIFTDRRWMQIIPLCGSAAVEVPYPERTRIPSERVTKCADDAINRLTAVAKALLSSAPWYVRTYLGVGIFFSRGSVRKKLRDMMLKGLGDAVTS